VQWAPNRDSLCTAGDAQTNPSVASDGAPGAIVAWEDHGSALNSGIYAQRVRASVLLNPAWTAAAGDFNGILLRNSNNDLAPTIATDATGGAIVAWQHGPNLGAQVYSVRVRSNGSITGVPPVASPGIAPVMVWPNPFRDRVSLVFNLSKTTPAHGSPRCRRATGVGVRERIHGAGASQPGVGWASG
jgi:hypothetical protein